MPGAHEHAAFARTQRKGVAGPQEIGGFRVGIEQLFDRRGAIVRGDTGRRESARFDRNGKCRFVNGRVVAHHLRNLQFVKPRPKQRDADEAAGLFAHEVDRFGRDFLGRHHQIALVFAILVVEHDDHLAGADVVDRVLDRVKWRSALGRRRRQFRQHRGQPL